MLTSNFHRLTKAPTETGQSTRRDRPKHPQRLAKAPTILAKVHILQEPGQNQGVCLPPRDSARDANEQYAV